MALTRSKASNILDSDYKSSCRITSTTNITLSGGAPSTYDGVTLLANDRVLVQGQTDATQNGFYYVATLGTGSNGTWTRTTDANQSYSLSPGVTTYIEEGTANANRYYVINTTGNIVIGTTSISFTSFNGPRGGNAMLQFNDATTINGATYWSYNKTSGNLYSNSTTTSTSTTTGALVVGAGVGIGGNLNVGGPATFTGNLLPSANVTYSLGSSTQRWSNIWLSGNTIYLGSLALKDTNGTFSIYDATGTNLINLNSSSINNTPVGNATPSTGAFTTLTATQTSNFAGTVTAATLQAANIGNTGAIITGTHNGPLNGPFNGTVGATTANTGAFTTLTANDLVTLTNATNSTNSNSGSLVVSGGLGVAKNTFIGGNLTVVGNLSVQGLNTIVGSTDLTVNDSVINLHTYPNLAAWTVNDGRDIGFKLHYFDSTLAGGDNLAFLGRANDTGFLEFYTTGVENSSNVFTSGTYGTVKTGELVAANSTISISTATGALRVSGGAGIAGNVYVGGQLFGYLTGAIGANTANTGSFTTVTTSSTLSVSGTAAFAGTVTAATINATTIGNSNTALSGTSLSVAGTITAATIYATTLGNINTAISGASSTLAGTLNAAAVQALNIGNTGATITGTHNGPLNGPFNGTVGATTANTGAFTTITASSTLGVSGTANFAGTLNAATLQASTIGNSGALLTGTLTTNAQPNVTSLGTLSSLAVTANASVGNLIAGTYGVYSANYYWANGNASIVSYTASSSAPTALRNGDQWYDTSADILYTRVNDGSSSFWLDISSVPNSFSNLVATQANVATLNVTGNLNFTNVAAYVTVAGNITAGNIVSSTGGLYALNYYYPNGVPFTGGASSIPGGSVGMLQFGDTGFTFAGATNLKYDKTTGNLVSNVSTASTSKTTGAIVTAGGVGIGGNVFANAIYTDNHYFANGATITTPAGGSNTYVQFNDSSTFSGTAGLTFNKGSNVLTVGGNVGIGTSSVSSSYKLGVQSTGTQSAGYFAAPTGYSSVLSLAGNGSSAGSTSFDLVQADTGIAYVFQRGNNSLIFGTNNTEKMRIDSSGNVGIANTSPAHALSVTGNVAISNKLVLGTGGISWANGNAFTSSKFTTSSTAPTGNGVGDFWYKSGSDILYQYVNDGTSSFFLDLTTKPSIYSNLAITSNLYVSGTISSTLTPAANVTLNLGSTTANWGTVYAVTFSGTSTTAKYADLAENYLSDEPLDPGDVVIFGGRKEIKSSYRYADTRIAGVISTNPAYLMNSDLDDSYPVALTGRVPCKVLGPVSKGDVLTSSNVVGVAQALNRGDFEPGCVLGKSLEDHSNNTVKTIEIVVGRF